ncbi:MAG TPA: DNA repair protein RecO [Alphaproteobacteria bacterium]|jgi:DNA repair protein RecO (recombination protein O)|nr:DNA repair protein RecO [Alphaproteobacteria bacterium]
MKPHSYSSEGIVLSRRNFGEADRILSLFTKHNGRISLIAKGVRRPASRKRGHIEVFNLVKFQAVSGNGIDIMTEVEVMEDFSLIRKSLKKISLAYYFMEVVGKITHEHETNIELFNLIFDTLTKLKITKKLQNLRLDFISKLLILMGYWPHGQILPNPDEELEKVIERQINSVRVGKRMVQ